jgi:hypothetical protein
MKYHLLIFSLSLFLASCEKLQPAKTHLICNGTVLFHTDKACRGNYLNSEAGNIKFSIVISDEELQFDDTTCLGSMRSEKLRKNPSNDTKTDFDRKWVDSEGLERLDDFTLNRTTGEFGMGSGYLLLGQNTPLGDDISIRGKCQKVEPIIKN